MRFVQEPTSIVRVAREFRLRAPTLQACFPPKIYPPFPRLGSFPSFPPRSFPTLSPPKIFSSPLSSLIFSPLFLQDLGPFDLREKILGGARGGKGGRILGLGKGGEGGKILGGKGDVRGTSMGNITSITCIILINVRQGCG